MASYDAGHRNAPQATKRQHAKLHKRSGSDASTTLPNPPSALRGYGDSVTSSFYDSPLQSGTATPTLGTTPKIKPYLRKISAGKEDQGKLDLSRSTVENEKLAGLGIQDYSPRAADVSFSRSGRRTASHSRTISGGSQVSNGSGSYRPTQPFVHPMRQTPRPYTPPTGRSSLNDEEVIESSDIVDDDFRLGSGFRTRRSMSVSSTPQIPPTPLSQTHTASDLGLVPKITNASQTNLSIRSNKSSGSKLAWSRRDAERSFEQASPSTRPSFDMGMSFVSRKSDLDPQTRDERIREARKKFEEKEADKDRKAAEDQTRKQARQARRSESSEKARPVRLVAAREAKPRGRKDSKRPSTSDNVDARPYHGYRESNEAALPIQGRSAGTSEKPVAQRPYQLKPARSGWVRFETWARTRMVSCGRGSE
nr:hypothetical protein B0A51_15411 [Rachicladosporium sp. CCFEE 5018]